MKKLFAFMLTLLTVVTFGATLRVNAASTGRTYSKVTEVSKISDGDTFVLSTESGKAGSYYDSKKLFTMNATMSGGKIVEESGLMEFTFKKGTSKDLFIIQNGTNCFEAANSGTNVYLQADTTNGAGFWKLNASGEIQAPSGRTIGYSDSGYFRSYNNYTPVYIYKKDALANGINTTFDLGYEGSTPIIVETEKGQAVAFPSTPYRNGFVFEYWQNAEGVRVDNLDANEATTLYAVWKKDTSSKFVIDIKNFTKPNSGGGYAAYNGTRTIDGIEIASTNVMIQEQKIQFKDATGAGIYNTNQLEGYITKIVIESSNKFNVYTSASSIASALDAAVEGNENVFVVDKNLKHSYFRIESNNQTSKAVSIEIYYEPVAAPKFTEVEAKSSLKISYDEAFAPTNVDLRFGGLIDKDLYNASNEYGVIVLANTPEEIAKLDNLTVEGLTTLKTDLYAHEFTPVEVKDGYQFSWVISNMEGHYDFEFKAVLYRVVDGNVELSMPKVGSVHSVAQTYIDNKTSLGLSEDVVTVLNNILLIK